MKNITRSREFTLQMNLAWEPGFDTNDIKFLNIRIHIGGGTTDILSWQPAKWQHYWQCESKTKSSTKVGTNIIKQIPSKILRRKTLKLTASKKATWIWLDLSIYYSFWICPPIHSITLQWWTVIPQWFNSSEMYNSKLIF